jgi:uncharacterized protein YjbI with pentapeptide repeats
MPIEEWLKQADRLYGSAVASMESPVLGIAMEPRHIAVDAGLLRQFIEAYAEPMRLSHSKQNIKTQIYPSLMTYMRLLLNIQPYQILVLSFFSTMEKNIVFSDFDLSYCDFRGCQFAEGRQAITFHNCSFNHAILRDCDLSRVRFEQCVLDHSDWRGARAGEAQLIYDGLHGMQIEGLLTHIADLERAKTYGIMPLGIMLNKPIQDVLYQKATPQSAIAIAERKLRRIDASCLHAYISDLHSGNVAANTSFNSYVADFYDMKKAGRGKHVVIADLSGMDFSEESIDAAGANFSSVIASGANFRGCHLQRSNWQGACLEGADFSHANLEASNLKEINGNYLKAISANLQGAMLQNARCERAVLIDANLCHAHAQHSHMAYADMAGAQVSHAYFDHIDAPYLTAVNANFSRANLLHANFSHADMRHVDWSWALLSRACLVQADCAGGIFTSATLEKVDASHADFSDSTMENANLEMSNLSHAILQRMQARYANFSGADLSYAECSESVLSYANFTKVCAEGMRCNDVLMDHFQGVEMILDHAVLRYINGEGMQLSYASLRSVEWMHSHLVNSDFSNANSERGVWCYNRMQRTNLSGFYAIGGKWRHNHCQRAKCDKMVVDHTTKLCANNWRDAEAAETIVKYQRQWHADHGCWRHWLVGWMCKKQQRTMV